MIVNITKEISVDSCSNTIIHNGLSLSITEKEKRLLCALLEHARDGNILCRDVLISRVWPEREQGIADTNILQLVHRLRRVLHQCGLENAIKTIYRQGYTFIVPSATESPQSEMPSVPVLPCNRLVRQKIFNQGRVFLCVLLLMLLVIQITAARNSFPFLPSVTRISSQEEHTSGAIEPELQHCPVYIKTLASLLGYQQLHNNED